jgi:hypothetical protein
MMDRNDRPMTWDVGEIDDDEADEDEDHRHDQAWRQRLQRLNVDQVVVTALEQISGKDLTPLHHLVDAWIAVGIDDLDRPQVAPSTCEALGKWMAIQLARALHHALKG